MKVLVIGANGNTATRVIRRLIESNHDPVAMIGAEQKQQPLLTAYSTDAGLRIVGNR